MSRGLPIAQHRAVQVSGRALAHSNIPDSVVDNFEEADANPAGSYESGENISTYYSGDTSFFARQQSTVFGGSYAIEVTQSDEGSFNSRKIISQEGDGLPRYPQRGETFEVRKRIDSVDDNNSIRLIFGARDFSNHYEIHFNPGSDIFALNKISNELTTELASDTISIRFDEWYRVEVNWSSDDTITVMLDDSADTQVTQISASDSTFSDETGVGFHSRGRNNDTAQSDEVKIIL